MQLSRTYDFITRTPIENVTVNARDCRAYQLVISFSENGIALDLSGKTVTLFARRHGDSLVFFLPCVIDTEVTGCACVSLSGGILSVSDVLSCEFSLFGENTVLTTDSFTLHVEDVIRDDEAIENSSEFTALTELMQSAPAVSEMLSMAGDVNTALENVESALNSLEALSVIDGSVTSSKLADGAVSINKTSFFAQDSDGKVSVSDPELESMLAQRESLLLAGSAEYTDAVADNLTAAIKESLSSAVEYTDSGISVLTSSFTVADSAVLEEAKLYTDQREERIRNSMEDYADSSSAAAVSRATLLINNLRNDLTSADSTTLKKAKDYSDTLLEEYSTSFSSLLNGIKTYSETKIDILSGTPVYEYTLTTDTEFQSGKAYYTLDGDYAVTQEGTDWISGDSIVADTYYEYTISHTLYTPEANRRYRALLAGNCYFKLPAANTLNSSIENQILIYAQTGARVNVTWSNPENKVMFYCGKTPYFSADSYYELVIEFNPASGCWTVGAIESGEAVQ